MEAHTGRLCRVCRVRPAAEKRVAELRAAFLDEVLEYAALSRSRWNLYEMCSQAYEDYRRSRRDAECEAEDERLAADEKKDWRYVRCYRGQIVSLGPWERGGEIVYHAGQWWLEVWYYPKGWQRPTVFAR